MATTADFTVGDTVRVRRGDSDKGPKGTVIQKTAASSFQSATSAAAQQQMSYSYVVEFPEATPGARRNADGKCVEVGVHPSRMVAVPREDAVLVPRGTKAIACLQLGAVAVMDAAAAPGFAATLYEMTVSSTVTLSAIFFVFLPPEIGRVIFLIVLFPADH